MKFRIYTDTSVLGGCEDEEFAEHSVRLVEGFIRGERILARPIHEPSAATSRLAASAALRSLRVLNDLQGGRLRALARSSLHLQPFATFRSRPHE